MRLVGIGLIFVALSFAAPPVTRKGEVRDNLHGTVVTDPYRWLEDSNSEAVRAWIKEQNAYTGSILDPLPGRDELVVRLRELNRYTLLGPPEKAGGRRFFEKREPGQNQYVLWVQEADGSSRVLLDPNTLDKQGLVSMASFAPSPDGKRVAYALARSGSDWLEFLVRDVETGKDLADRLEWIKAAIPVWDAAGTGVYYRRLPVPRPGEVLTAQSSSSKVYFHKLGRPQTEDELIWERPDKPEWNAFPWMSPDGRHRLLTISHGTRPENIVLHEDMRTRRKTTLVAEFSGMFRVIGARDGEIFFRTTDQAPRGRIIAISLADPAKSHWRTVIPEDPDAVLDGASFGSGQLFCTYTRNVQALLRAFSISGKPVRDIPLPGLGTVLLDRNDRSDADPEQYFGFAGYLQPLTWYRYLWKEDRSELLLKNDYAFDPADFETRLVFYPSKDGTRVPLFLSGRKGLPRNGRNPVLLTGYGGFGLTARPGFTSMAMAWMEMGGIYAHAALRGGSEFGQAWHDAGRLKNKQNVFDDFIAAAEYLIREKYTSREKLAITGGSNGGLLVGAVLNQRPDLFGAAIPRVGVMDMLRFHKFTVGRFWTSDYGDPEKAEDFEVLRRYSPLHNIRKGTAYPPTMVMTADHDDRVVPAHSFKYAAALQAAQEGKAPIFIRIEENAGHSAGKPVSKRIEEDAEILRFLRFALKMEGSR
jgi:prolyl oligopeptidase